ncbi:MAG: hypothetical protein WA191_06945 [Telluria sp.]
MRQGDYDAFAKLLDDAYDMISVGTKSLSAPARAMFFRAVAKYPLEVFRAALHAHILGKEGRFVPQPSHIIEQIEAMTESDGRPGAEEAWAIALTSRDEQDTVVWTQETAEAFAIARPVLDSSGAISARKPFLEAYTRLVTQARAEHRPAQWRASIGFDKERQVTVIKKAINAGLLPAPAVAGLLKGPANDPTPDDKARAQIEVIRKMLTDSQAAKERHMVEDEARRVREDAEFKARTQERVDAYLGGAP